MNITIPGIEVRKVLGLLLHFKKKLGFTVGPAIAEILDDLFQEDQALFPAYIQTNEDIRDHYQCFRTFRRSSTTIALEIKVSKADIDIVNRWRKVEAADGKRPNLPMHLHYSQVANLEKPYL